MHVKTDKMIVNIPWVVCLVLAALPKRHDEYTGSQPWSWPSTRQQIPRRGHQVSDLWLWSQTSLQGPTLGWWLGAPRRRLHSAPTHGRISGPDCHLSRDFWPPVLMIHWCSRRRGEYTSAPLTQGMISDLLGSLKGWFWGCIPTAALVWSPKSEI